MARQVKVNVGDKEKVFNIAPLKGKHIRDIMTNKRPGFEETFAVLGMAGISEKDIDEMDFKDCLKLQKEINAETFGVEEEVKN